MTRHEATCNLVVGVLGLKIRSGEQEGDGTPAVVILDEAGGLSEYDPWTDVDQAVKLAEAWCGLKADVRGFMITSVVDPETGKSGYVAILRPGTEYTEIAFSLATTLTGAVSKAMGLEVKEA